MQHPYDEFETIVKSEMKNKLPTYKTNLGTKHMTLRPLCMMNKEFNGARQVNWLHYTGAKRNKSNLKEAYCM